MGLFRDFTPIPIKITRAQARENLRRSKCKAIHSQHGPAGDDWDCGYDTTIDCDVCKYAANPGRKDPAAKCNQRKE